MFGFFWGFFYPKSTLFFSFDFPQQWNSSTHRGWIWNSFPNHKIYFTSFINLFNLVINSKSQNTLCETCFYLRLKFYPIIYIITINMYNRDINSSDWSGRSVPVCVPHVWHAVSAYSVFSSSHDMRALEHMRQEVFLYCCCQACLLFSSELSLVPFFSSCLSWTDDLCASTSINGLLQRHGCSCNCACESQQRMLAVLPPAGTCRCRSELLCLIIYSFMCLKIELNMILFVPFYFPKESLTKVMHL